MYASDGPCPLLSCGQTGWHSHPVCEICEAVQYGNISCGNCLNNFPAYDRHILALRILHGRHN